MRDRREEVHKKTTEYLYPFLFSFCSKGQHIKFQKVERDKSPPQKKKKTKKQKNKSNGIVLLVVVRTQG